MMSEYSERILTTTPTRTRRTSGVHLAVMLVAPFFALLFEVYVLRFPLFSFLSYLELPLLIVVYFALARREPVSAVFYGAVGNHPIKWQWHSIV